jgi:hypothetical protein
MLIQKKVKLLLLTIVFVGTAFAPWIPSFIGQLQSSAALRVQMPNWGTAVSSAPIKGLAHLALRLLGGVQTYDGTPTELVYFGLPILLTTIILTGTISHQKKWDKQKILTHPYFWWGMGIFIAWCVSWFMPIFAPKRVLFAFPLWFLLLEFFITRISKSNIIKATFVSIFLVHMMWGISLYWSVPRLQRENWRGVYQLLQQAVHADETLVLFREYEAFSPWVFYEQRYKAQFPTLALAPQHQVTDENLRQYQSILLEYNQVILFDYLADLTDPERKTEQWLASHGYKQEDALDAGLIGIIHLYRKEAVYAHAQHWY